MALFGTTKRGSHFSLGFLKIIFKGRSVRTEVHSAQVRSVKVIRHSDQIKKGFTSFFRRIMKEQMKFIENIAMFIHIM